MKKPIPCELFDYIEIACMFGYKVELTLHSGERYCGVAITTHINQDKQEFLVLQLDSTPPQNIEIETSNLSEMTVLTENARFEQVRFH